MKSQISWLCIAVIVFGIEVSAYHYDERYLPWNLNTNPDAQTPLSYSGQWDNHQYHPSPDNWRFPFYSLFLDRFVNGDPTNDNINGTLFEHDPTSNQMRHGGDLQGLVDTLDYLAGMGIKGLFIAGSPFMNAPWKYDSYSPLDLTILDQHWGTIETWRYAIKEIHNRGMYVILDNTFATMGDLIGFQGYLNETTPFTTKEHKVQWKGNRKYWDFEFSNDYNTSCQYPRLWLETGYPVGEDVTSQLNGCYDSDFDQYGDTEAFGVFPDWRRQLTKFASVQDRLREWHEPVRQKLERFYCIMITQLDIDGYRYDKATQSTVDAMGSMNNAMRACARKLGKQNFFLPGEITGGNVFASIYLGRGRQPDQQPEDLTTAVSLSNTSDDRYFIRDHDFQSLDASAFHYTTYRTMTRFLGMDGNLEAGYDAPRNWVDQWNTMLMTNDLVNANTGQFDPRHMYGVTNQDVFRWGAITQGVQRQLLGHFITSLLLPGMPLLLWGEEQAFYMLDNTASNYIFGRQPMSSATAWMIHGCYSLLPPSTQFYQMPIDAARRGCHDQTQVRDQRDPTHPVRNILRHMFWLREQYPVLNDGAFLQQLSNQTEEIVLAGSSGVATEFGVWSVLRSQFPGVQNFETLGMNGDLSIWLIYSNVNETREYSFDCGDTAVDHSSNALISPYPAGTTVKNLFHPFDEFTLVASGVKLGINGSTEFNGCTDQLTIQPYGFSAYVPKTRWVEPRPMMTKFLPGHDARIESTTSSSGSEDVEVEIQFSEEMDCQSVTNSVILDATTITGNASSIKTGSVQCSSIPSTTIVNYTGNIPSVWSWKATLTGVQHGVHALIVADPQATDSGLDTQAVEKLLFRIGSKTNPVTFPLSADYSTTLLAQADNDLVLRHDAAGADQWRYSTNWGSTFSDWMAYTGEDVVIEPQHWSGTNLQRWVGTHVRVEYFSRRAGTSDIVQQGDLGDDLPVRRYPHLFWNGPYNEYGFDRGLDNQFKLVNDSTWQFDFAAEWLSSGVPSQVNVWGMNPDGQPDLSFVYGDIDGDSVLDRLTPAALAEVSINITSGPPKPYTGWTVVIDDSTNRFRLLPIGNMNVQMALYILLCTLPILGGVLAVWTYIISFYNVKFNKIGIVEKNNRVSTAIRRVFDNREKSFTSETGICSLQSARESCISNSTDERIFESLSRPERSILPFTQPEVQVPDVANRRTVLIATIEYDIEDWNIKVKIGGLGVMASLMGKNLAHQDLIWVVPCVSDVEYPEDIRAEPMEVAVMGKPYEVKVQYHRLRNITYVLLDAPIFRSRTKTEPYMARMDDMDSAIYYSTWNQCIAQAIERFPVDLYHINDYHGTIAPLHLLPRTIPTCLSLHNAEFQGLWPMRTKMETEEVCSVFNLPVEVAQRYVQFGEVFNLLHAGASLLREHQDGFGAVGVSKKYGRRAYARYPIFWGLKTVGQLPNPDPSDTAEWDKKLPQEDDVVVDADFETSRADLRRQAQEWAGLEVNPDAELFVFVGRWSMQKGVDLIADVFPSLLESNPNIQLIAVGPVVDLYGKFAAAKLDKMMEIYPGRVMSKPVFTALPPYVFSGAEFALIPSRDEPFGLVAVEFGRKGALGVGSRVGGLGQMPGFWYTVESMTTSHLTRQFKLAIKEALATGQSTRALMRARSAKQRFPVAQWVEDLEILQTTSIRLHDQRLLSGKRSRRQSARLSWSAPAGERPTIRSRAASFGSSYDHNNRTSMQSVRNRLSVSSTRDGNKFHKRDSQEAPELTGSQSLRELSRISGLNASTTSLRRPSIIDRGSIHQHNNAAVLVPQPSLNNQSVDSQLSSMLTFPSSSRTSLPACDRVRSASQDLSRSQSNLYNARSTFIGRDSSDSRTGWPLRQLLTTSTIPSLVGVEQVVGEKTDYKLQKVDLFFTDTAEKYYREFQRRLEDLSGRTSDKTCIEEYLMKSEKEWFENYRDAKIGRNTLTESVAHTWMVEVRSRLSSSYASRPPSMVRGQSEFIETLPAMETANSELQDEFLLGEDYKAPGGLKKFMQVKVLTWPVYTYLLAFGQVIAANSYQITLLTGEIGQSATKLYAVASIYLAASVGWWLLYRRFPSRICLSLPFFFYGLAFFFIAVSRYGATVASRGWIQNFGTVSYTIASSSGSLFFALNFGDECSAQRKTWVYRACVIQGTQQLYIVALWAWGSIFARRSALGIPPPTVSPSITVACLPVTLLFWSIGLVLYFGLPFYYRQQPGTISSFYVSITRRKVTLWFFLAVIIQNFFLSAPYGRNWSFLFSSAAAPAWSILALAAFFFVFVWFGILFTFAQLSKEHSWILPMFALGLGAPRWAQIWWGTSGMGLYLPFVPGGPVGNALFSRSLWLWLGTLDAFQGVGIGMILLITLTRVHVAFTLSAAQVLGSIATILARATAPNKTGPGPISPDVVNRGLGELAQSPGWFWIGLICNLGVCVGFFMFFRKEQLTKP